MARKVVLVRGGMLGANTGIGGAHHTLKQTLESGGVSGWDLHGVAEYDLGQRPSGLKRIYHRWFKHPRTVQNLTAIEGVDLIHITDQEQAHLVPKNSQIPVAVTVHDLFHTFPETKSVGGAEVEVGDANPSFIRRKDLTKLRKGLARADVLFCDSYATLNACKTHFPHVKSVWLPLGLKMTKFSPQQTQMPARTTPSSSLKKACHLLIVGSHDPRKRMKFLFEILGELNPEVKAECHVHHVGNPTSPVHEASVLELAHKYGVEHFTAHGGDLSDEALMELRHASEALLFPSMSEGFGYPPLEAMATGTAVLCADFASHNELMPEGACLSGSDKQAWVAAIEHLHAAWKERTRDHDVHVWPSPDEALIEHAHSFSLRAYQERTSTAYSDLF